MKSKIFLILIILFIININNVMGENGTLTISASTGNSYSIPGAGTAGVRLWEVVYFDIADYNHITKLEMTNSLILFSNLGNTTTFTVTQGGTGSGTVTYDKNLTKITWYFVNTTITSSPFILNYTINIFNDVSCTTCNFQAYSAPTSAEPVFILTKIASTNYRTTGEYIAQTQKTFYNSYNVTYSPPGLFNLFLDKENTDIVSRIYVQDLQNTSRYFVENTLNSNSFSGSWEYANGLALKMIDTSGNSDLVVVNTTYANIPEPETPCTTGEPESKVGNFGGLCFEKRFWSFGEVTSGSVNINEPDMGTKYNYTVQYIYPNGSKTNMSYLSAAGLQDANSSGTTYQASLLKTFSKTEIGTVRIVVNKYNYRNFNSIVDSFYSEIDIYDPTVPPEGTVHFNKTAYNLYENFNVSWAITSFDANKSYYMTLYQQGISTEIGSYRLTAANGSKIFQNSLLPKKDISGTYEVFLENLEPYQIMDTDTVYYGSSQINGTISILGNFTMLNSVVSRGENLRLRYNMTNDGWFVIYDYITKKYTYISVGSNVLENITIPETYRVGIASIRLYYHDIIRDVDVLLQSDVFTVAGNITEGYYLFPEKDTYKQGESIVFSAYLTSDGYVVLKNPDGKIVRNVTVSSGVEKSVGYFTDTSDKIGTYFAYMWNSTGFVTQSSTELTAGMPTPTSTIPSTATPTPISTAAPGSIPGSSSGVETAGCPTTGNSLMDIGGILGCQVFGKIETDSSGDVKNSPQNRMIGYNGLYTVMLIVLIIFVFGVYGIIRGKR